MNARRRHAQWGLSPAKRRGNRRVKRFPRVLRGRMLLGRGIRLIRSILAVQKLWVCRREIILRGVQTPEWCGIPFLHRMLNSVGAWKSDVKSTIRETSESVGSMMMARVPNRIIYARRIRKTLLSTAQGNSHKKSLDTFVQGIIEVMKGVISDKNKQEFYVQSSNNCRIGSNRVNVVCQG